MHQGMAHSRDRPMKAYRTSLVCHRALFAGLIAVILGLAIFPLWADAARLRYSRKRYRELRREMRSLYRTALRKRRRQPCLAYTKIQELQSLLRSLYSRRLRRGRWPRRYRYRLLRSKRYYWKRSRRWGRRIFRSCRRRWRRKFRRGRLRRVCRRKFRRRGRRYARLWLGVKPRSKVYLRGRYCGLTPLRATIRNGRYRIRIVAPSGETYRTSVYLRRRQTFVILRTFSLAPAVAARTRPTPRTPTRRPAPRGEQPPLLNLNNPNNPTLRRTPPRTRVFVARRQPPQRPNPARRKVAQTDDPEITPGGGVKKTAPPPQGPPAFYSSAGIRLFSRTLYYNDDIFGALPPYNLLIAPAVAASLTWFPAAPFTKGPLANFGLVADFHYAFGLESKAAQDSISTSSYLFNLGALIRFPLGAFVPHLQVAYGAHAFGFSQPNVDPADLPVPSTNYQRLQLGLGFRWQITERFSLIGQFAYLLIFDAGQIATRDFFPRLFVGGIDGNAALSIKLYRWLEVHLGITLLHYFYTMNPEPGDRRVAGGAIDQYLNFDLRVALSF